MRTIDSSGSAHEPELAKIRLQVSGLFVEHSQALLRYALVLTRDRELAQEAVQESFLRYLLHRQTGHQVDNERAFVYRILRNWLVDHSRGLHGRATIAFERLAEWPDERQDPARPGAEQQLMQRVRAALSSREMEIVMLRADGFTYDEIAGQLQIHSGTVGSHLARATRKLRRTFPRRAQR
jgi:RNA polymerase sigma-70 factor (ECF subfamily)